MQTLKTPPQTVMAAAFNDARDRADIAATANSRVAGALVRRAKADLVLGENRQITIAHMKAIKANWDPRKAGTLVVARRLYSNNEEAVIDGQHRFLAAPDDTVFACFLVDVASVEAETALWFAYNTKRRAVSSVDRFLMAVRAGDQSATEINGWIEATGRKVPNSKASGPGLCTCVHAIMRAYHVNRDTTKTAIGVTSDICRGNIFHETVFLSVFYLIQRAPTDVNWSHWTRRLIAGGYHSLMSELSPATSGGRSGLIGAITLLKIINRGLRLHNRLIVPGINGGDID